MIKRYGEAVKAGQRYRRRAGVYGVLLDGDGFALLREKHLVNNVLDAIIRLELPQSFSSTRTASDFHHRPSDLLTADFIFSRPARAISKASIPQYFRLNSSSDSTVCPPLSRKVRKISVTGATPSPG